MPLCLAFVSVPVLEKLLIIGEAPFLLGIFYFLRNIHLFIAFFFFGLLNIFFFFKFFKYLLVHGFYFLLFDNIQIGLVGIVANLFDLLLVP